MSLYYTMTSACTIILLHVGWPFTKTNPNARQSDKKASHAKEKFGIGKNIAGSDAENIILAQNNHPPTSKV